MTSGSILLLLRPSICATHRVASSAFRKPRRTVDDIRACIPDIFPRWTHIHGRRGPGTPLLRRLLWTVDVGQEFVIPRPSHSRPFTWRGRISAIPPAEDNCRGNGIPPCKKSRVMSCIIFGWRYANVPPMTADPFRGERSVARERAQEHGEDI